MKVLYVEAYPGFRGAQRSLATLVGSLVRPVAGSPDAAVDPTIRCTHAGRAADGYRRQGLRVEIHPAPARLLELGGGLARRGLAGQLATVGLGLVPDTWRWLRRLRLERPDLVHCNQARGVLLAGPAARLLGLPVIWHQRGLLDLPGWARTLASRLATDTVCVSTAVRESLPEGIRHRARVIANGIDTGSLPDQSTVLDRRHRLEAEAARLGARAGAVHLVTASSFLPYKGLHHLATALGALLHRRPDWRQRLVWTVLGDSEGDPARERYRHHLEQQVAALPHAPTVFWAGWLDDPLPVLAAADLVVLPTLEAETFRFADGETLDVTCSEGLPRTVLEALALGRVVVATDVAGVRDLVVDGESGKIVPPGDPEALARTLETLLDSAARRHRLGEAARQRAKLFSAKTKGEEMMSLYHQILTHGHTWRR